MKKNEDVEYGKLIGRAEVEEKVAEGMEIHLVPKEFEAYSDGQTYSRDRAFEKVVFFLKHEIASKYEVGKVLLLIKEMEGIRRGGDRKSAQEKSKCDERTLIFEALLTRYIPSLSPRRAYEYILFAQKATPKFREWVEGGKNWKKALALLDIVDAEGIKALESGDPVSGMTLDDVDKMTFTELKANLRKARQKIARGEEQNAKKTEEVARLQKNFKPTEEQFHIMLEGCKMHFDRLLSDIEPEAMWEKLGNTTEVREGKKEKPTVRMKAHYLEVIGYLKKCILAANGGAEEMFGTPDMFPENVWRPGEGAKVVDEVRERELKKLEEKKKTEDGR